MIAAAAAAALAAAAAASLVAGSGGALPRPPWARGLLPGFALVEQNPGGGTVWLGRVPSSVGAGPRNETAVYLPPGFSRTRRYPVVYLLHGTPGSPLSYLGGLHLPARADRLIRSGRAAPFIAVMPAAGYGRFRGEWAGIWEDYVVRDVVPWVDRHLPTRADAAARTLAGLSAGGFGALDIGLRHPALFGRLEAWSGYFRPIRDGVLRHAGPAELRSHDPSLLLPQLATLLRRDGIRFYLSASVRHDAETLAATRRFAALLARERLPYRLVLARGGHNSWFWRRQLGAALTFASPPPPGPTRLQASAR